MDDYGLFDIPYSSLEAYNTDNYDYRRNTIKAISSLRDGNGFELYYKRFIVGTSKKQKKAGGFTKEDFRKFYLSENYMESVIGKFVSYMPKLTFKTNIDPKLNTLIKKSLKDIKWESTIYDAICDTMESKGDVYLAIYFDNEEDKLPKLKHLKSENMVDIIVDEHGVPIAYVYEEDSVRKKIDPSNGEVIISDTIKTRFVFSSGKIIKYSDGEIPKTIINNECLKDDIPLIHIQADKKEGQVFSSIPSKAYIEDVLHLDKCTTLISQTLEYQGFGLKYIIDGELNKGSRPVPGGHMGVSTDQKTKMRGMQAKVNDFQINNELKANFNEKEGAKSALYEKARLIAPDTEKIVGKTDSGKVFQHFRLPLQTKVRKYRDSIIDGMTIWFKALFISNGIDYEPLDGFTFYKDLYIIETSADEKTLNQQLELSNKTKTVKIIKEENGSSPDEIKEVLGEIEKEKEELRDEKNDTTNVKEA